MPKVSGKDLISEATEKVVRRTMFISGAVILVKAYSVDLEDLSLFGLSLPAELFDVVALVLILYHLYSLTINWVGDLAAFRLWYRESEIWSQFQTNMKLDKSFISGGIKLFLRLLELEKKDLWPENYADLDEDAKKEFTNFKTNVELFNARLAHAGTQFRALSNFGRYYVWVQSFSIPVILAVTALLMLLLAGEPNQQATKP